MYVHIVQAWYYSRALQIDDSSLSSLERFNGGVLADGNDDSAFYRYGPRPTLWYRDVPVTQYQIRFLHGLGRREGVHRDCGCDQREKNRSCTGHR
jgi:hypothetical protein